MTGSNHNEAEDDKDKKDDGKDVIDVIDDNDDPFSCLFAVLNLRRCNMIVSRRKVSCWRHTVSPSNGHLTTINQSLFHIS